MDFEKVWVSVLIFSAKDKWQQLIVDIIQPCIDNYLASDRYILELSPADSDTHYIRLLFSVKGMNKLDALTNITHLINRSRFKNSPECINLSENIQITEVCGDSAENDIPYQLKESYHMRNPFLSTVFSSVIIEALREESIDDDLLITFSCYLQLGLVKVFKSLNIDILVFLKDYLYTSTQNSKEVIVTNYNHIKSGIQNGDFLTEELFEHLRYNSNEALLSQIADDVMNNNLQELPAWFVKWILICEGQIDHFKEGVSPISKFESIIGSVYGQLGLSVESCNLALHFVKRVLNLINTPTIILMGAQKCGTTTLHNTLVEHSLIKAAAAPITNYPIKEVNFFCHPSNWEKGTNWYLSHFSGEGHVFIDSSPNYLSSPFCFERMKTLIPDAKLIICLRNPVLRAFSQYNHYKQLLPFSENWDWKYNIDFLANVKDELNNIKQQIIGNRNFWEDQTQFSGLLKRGIYIYQLKNLLKYYDRSQIYITVMEHWPQLYQSELKKIQGFLDLRGEHLPQIIANKREYNTENFSAEAMELLKNFYSTFNQELFDFLGYKIKEWM